MQGTQKLGRVVMPLPQTGGSIVTEAGQLPVARALKAPPSLDGIAKARNARQRARDTDRVNMARTLQDMQLQGQINRAGLGGDMSARSNEMDREGVQAAEESSEGLGNDECQVGCPDNCCCCCPDDGCCSGDDDCC